MNDMLADSVISRGIPEDAKMAANCRYCSPVLSNRGSIGPRSRKRTRCSETVWLAHRA